MIWKDSRWVHALLLLLALGQWTLVVIRTCASSHIFPRLTPFLEVAVNLRTININGFCEAYLIYPQMDVAALIYSGPIFYLQTGVVLIESV